MWNPFKKKTKEDKILKEIENCRKIISKYTDLKDDLKRAVNILETYDSNKSIPLRFHNAEIILPVDKDWIMDTICYSEGVCNSIINNYEEMVINLKQILYSDETETEHTD